MDDYDDNERLRQEVRRLKAQVFALEEEKEDPAPPVPVRLPGTGEDAREAAAVVDPHVVSEPS